MRIFHLITTREPQACGVLTAATAIIDAQCKLGHDVRYFISTPSKIPFLYGKRLQNPPATFLCSKISPQTIINNHRYIKKEIKYFTPDIIHIHSVYSLNNFMAGTEAKNNRIPYIVSPHGGYAPQIRKRRAWRKRFFELLFEKRLLGNSSCVIVVSDVEKNIIRKLTWHIPDIKMISNPIPQELLRIENNPNIHKKKKFNLGYAGRIDIYHKGLDLALRAICQLSPDIQENIRVYFLTPQNKIIINKLKRIANDSNLHARLIFLGPKEGCDKIKIIQYFDTLFLTSRWEVFGYAPVEALALGVPVVVSNNVPLAHIVKENNCGWVCAAEEKSIHKSLKLVLETSQIELKKMGSNGRVAVIKEFDPIIVANKVCSTYQEIVDKYK